MEMGRGMDRSVRGGEGGCEEGWWEIVAKMRVVIREIPRKSVSSVFHLAKQVNSDRKFRSLCAEK